MKSVDANGSMEKEVQVEVCSTDSVILDEIDSLGLHTGDNPSINPWTFRMFFLGLGLSTFGSTLATIFLFRPHAVSVSVIFLTIISYFTGNAFARFLPRKGLIGKWLNPHSFNSKEHTAIVIMAHTASTAAYAIEVLAALKLYYNIEPSSSVAILLLISTQLLGYGIAGMLRKTLVYPTKMVWPQVLPLCSLIETLHQNKSVMSKRSTFFWTIFCLVTVWELFPQYIMPALTGISVFCLANRKSVAFTNIFGGTNGNEGLGFLSICFDWQYIGTNPLLLPLVTIVNSFIGYLLCVALFLGLYYGNVWNALNFPLLGQKLYSKISNSTHFDVFNQTQILDSNHELNVTALESKGLPFFTVTHASYLLTTNMSIGAIIVHVILWNRVEMLEFLGSIQIPSIKKLGATFFPKAKYFSAHKSQGIPQSTPTSTPPSTPRVKNQIFDELDPHYRQMLEYKEVPTYWYLIIFICSISAAFFCTYSLKSTLPWWCLLISCALSFICTLFISTLTGQFGFNLPVASVIQMIGGYLSPGKPIANMYFILFGANTQAQALNLTASFKFAQYSKLSPRCTLVAQTLGAVSGALVNYIVMSTITTNKREILLSTQGTNIWSGRAIQSFNTNAMAFGALAKPLFSVGSIYQAINFGFIFGLLIPLPFYFLHKRFPKLGFEYIKTPIICWCLGYLKTGINSSAMMYFITGFYIQFYARRYHPEWFVRYNYLLAAAISGGTELLVFLTTFSVEGASGKEVPFPPYFGNNYQQGHFDFCAKNTALK